MSGFIRRNKGLAVQTPALPGENIYTVAGNQTDDIEQIPVFKRELYRIRADRAG
jgi:hypothetical protein